MPAPTRIDILAHNILLNRVSDCKWMDKDKAVLLYGSRQPVEVLELPLSDEEGQQLLASILRKLGCYQCPTLLDIDWGDMEQAAHAQGKRPPTGKNYVLVTEEPDTANPLVKLVAREGSFELMVDAAYLATRRAAITERGR